MVDARNSGGEASSSTMEDAPVSNTQRSEETAHNNTATSNGTAEDLAPLSTRSKASSTRNSTPGAASMEAQSSAQSPKDASSTRQEVQHSKEPATNAVEPARSSPKDSEPNGEFPSSYGTRSRNRPGRSRPNYAEDTEMDFEMGAAPTNGTMSDPPSRDSVAPDSGHSSGVSAKKGSGPAQSNASWGNSGTNSKDIAANPNIPGASTAVSSATTPSTTGQTTTTTTTTTKKGRKSAGANATNGSHATAPPSQTATGKRGNHAMVPATSARETNMMTFENTGALLKNGHLEADDGQIVNVNGKL